MNIFGGNTGMSYEDLQRKRAVADRLVQANTQTPRNVGEGLSAIGRALAARAIERRTSRREGELKAEADDLWKGVFGDIGGQSSGPQTYAAPAPAVSTTNIEGKAVADDTMRALGKEPIGMPAEVRAGVFAGESGGDYDAVFGYQQRPGGQFEGVKPSEMRVAEVLQFQDPSGPYGQYVKGQVGRVATPVGAYQVVGTTLREAVKAGVVSPDEKFTPEVQDRVGDWVYKTQGTGAWEGYRGPGGGGQGGGQGGVAPRQIASTQAIAEALSNPYIQKDPGKVAILQALLQQQLAPPPTMTPYQQAQLDMRQRELEMRQAGTWGDGTNVTVNNAGEAQPQIGTIPQGYMAVKDPNSPAGYRMVAIPGGPEDTSANEAEVQSAQNTAGEVVTTAAERAREAAGKRNLGGFGTSLVGSINPYSDSAEVMRQTDVLKSVASAEALNQMRRQSPTGGALGNVTEKELKLLSEQAGALDPNSPNFLRDLEDYERNLLRTIHGQEVGDNIFEATRKNAGDDGWTTLPNGVRVREKK